MFHTSLTPRGAPPHTHTPQGEPPICQPESDGSSPSFNKALSSAASCASVTGRAARGLPGGGRQLHQTPGEKEADAAKTPHEQSAVQLDSSLACGGCVGGDIFVEVAFGCQGGESWKTFDGQETGVVSGLTFLTGEKTNKSCSAASTVFTASQGSWVIAVTCS